MDIVFEPAWQRKDPKQGEQAKAFWEAHNLLPAELRDWRAKNELVVLARLDGAVVGVSTANIEYQPPLRGRFAMYRCAVALEAQRHDLVTLLTVETYKILAAWSIENPNEQLLGIGTVIDGLALGDKARQPMWPDHDLNLNLVGYTDRGEQIRIAWFKHARADIGGVEKADSRPVYHSL